MADEAEARALDAVGNPTRRAVLHLLRGGEHTVRELTDELPITQSAVSQHLRVLHDAGLVRVRADGTRRLYAVDFNGLAGVRAWIDSFWDDVLGAFVEHAEASLHQPEVSPSRAAVSGQAIGCEQADELETPDEKEQP